MSEKVTDGFDEFENALRSLQPTSQLHRDAVIYRAGQASARRGWLWPSLAQMMTATSAVLGVVLLVRPAPQPIERIVYVNVPTPLPVVIASVTQPRQPEPPLIETPLTPPTHFAQLTVGSIKHMRFDDWRWRPEPSSDSFLTPDTTASQPPTLMNLMNAWANEKPGKGR